MAENHDDFELIELEYTEEDIAYYIEDEDGNELGFAIVDENGEEVEYYYDGVEASQYESVDSAVNEQSDDFGDAQMKPTLQGSSAPKHQTAPKAKKVKEESLAYLAGNAAGKMKVKAKTVPDKLEQKKNDAKNSHAKEELKEAASDLNTLYHAGKEVGDELKAAYGDIAEVLDFLPGKKFKKLKR